MALNDAEDDTHATVRVDLGERSYEIVITKQQLGTLAETVDAWLADRSLARGNLAFVVTDTNVQTPHADVVCDSLRDAGWHVELAVLEPGEPSKRLSVISQLYDKLIRAGADRRSIVFGVGGGVVGDASGFVAATFARGLGFVQVPTSLLADVDSSVGGKVGINHPQAKNMIGAFHQPLGVFIDTAALETLPVRQYRAGLAEVVKYGMIMDAGFFELLEREREAIVRRESSIVKTLIARSCRLKADVVEEDEYERSGHRAILNYGHTFAHAYETLYGYGELLHGEAVAIGMIDASRLAEALGLIDGSVTTRQIELLTALGLPVETPETGRPSAGEVLERMKLDKKAVAGKLRFILPDEIGRVTLCDSVPEQQVVDVLRQRGLV